MAILPLPTDGMSVCMCPKTGMLPIPRASTRFGLSESTRNEMASGSGYRIEQSMVRQFRPPVSIQVFHRLKPPRGPEHFPGEKRLKCLSRLFVTHRCPVWSIIGAAYRSVREVEPLAVALGIHLLKPNAEPGTLRRSVSHAGHVSSISDCDVPVHLDLDRVQVIGEIGAVFDSFAKTCLIVDEQRLSTGRPAIAVSHYKVVSGRPVEESDVSRHDGFSDLPLQVQHLHG